MNLPDVIAELGQALSACGLNVTNTGAGDFPAVIISPPDAIRYGVTYGGTCQVDITVSVLVSAQDEASALALIYRLFSYADGTYGTPLPDALLTRDWQYVTRVEIVKASGFAFDPTANVLKADLFLTLFT